MFRPSVRSLRPEGIDPVLAAALAAPPCEEPIPEEALEGLDEDIAEMKAGRARMYSPAEMAAALEEMHHAAE